MWGRYATFRLENGTLRDSRITRKVVSQLKVFWRMLLNSADARDHDFSQKRESGENILWKLPEWQFSKKS